MEMHMNLLMAGLAILATASACTDEDFLDTGDVLIAVVEPGTLFVTSTSDDGCVENGGAKVRLIGQHADGTPAKEAKVQLWLTGPAAATLTLDSVTLSKEGTNEDACLLPTTFAGTSTLHARSGPIEVTTTAETSNRIVPTGGSIILAASPIASTSSTPPSSCGAVPQNACSPGTGRAAAVNVQALPAEAKPVPEGAQVTLSTSFGQLGATECGTTASSIANLVLVGGAATARLCLPDVGGKATVTAQSGVTKASIEVEVRSIPRAVLLVPNRAQATAGTTVSFTTIVTDCEGRGVPDVALVLRTRTGVFAPDDGTPAVPKTGADGSFTISGSATVVPLELSAELVGAAQVGCAATIGAQP